MTQPVKELNGGGTGISTGGPKKQASTGWQAAPPPPQSASLVQAVWVSALMHALAVLLAPFAQSSLPLPSLATSVPPLRMSM